MFPRSPSDPPDPPSPPFKTGELGSQAARMLERGFVAVKLVKELDGRDVHYGFAGDVSRDLILKAALSMGDAAREQSGLDEVVIQLQGGNRDGNRLIYYRQKRHGSDLRFVGEETPGEHRKSTPRNIRRLFKRLAPIHRPDSGSTSSGVVT